MKTKPQPFRLRLAQLARERGLSVAELAALSGLARRTVYKLLAGEREPALATAQSLAKALGVSLAVFDGVTPGV